MEKKIKKTLEEMLSEHAYDELKNKLSEYVSEKSMGYIVPAVKRALEEGGREVSEDILIGWLDCDSMRICTQCGAIMTEGWYLCDAGYACSDECAAKSEGITMEEFEKWRIYKDDIIGWLEDNGDPRKLEDLTKEECDEIIDQFAGDKEYYYTEWY